MKEILFVCTGNTCRSPMAEYIMNDLLAERGLDGEYFALAPGTPREASGVPCLNPRRGLTLLSPVCRDPAIGV